jgi:GDP-L-fucose synthase
MNLSEGKILITGATGFVGRNLVPLLQQRGIKPITPSHKEFDLLEQEQVRKMLATYKPDLVFHLGGLVGGIVANLQRPADFHYQNLVMGEMMLHECYKAGVKKYVTIIGGCSYPDGAPSPIKETELLRGYPQKDTAPYSLAKAMHVIQAQTYRAQYGFDAIVLVPGNMYGPYDNYDYNKSHVIPALIRKFVEAKAANAPQVQAWGSGKPTRDFVYIGDTCEALLIAAEKYSGPDIINISAGKTITIKELTEMIAELVGYKGQVVWDPSKPEGQLLKGFDATRLKQYLGYECPTSVREGLTKTIAWFKANTNIARLTG